MLFAIAAPLSAQRVARPAAGPRRPTLAAAAQARPMLRVKEGHGFGSSVGRSPMVVGGVSTSEKIRANQPSVFRSPQDTWTTRTTFPSSVPRYPETKHTVKCAATPRRRRLAPRHAGPAPCA